VRRVLIPAALAVALTIPAGAAASTHGYSGTVDPSGTLSFKVKKKHGKTRVRAFRFEQIPVTCDAGADTTFGKLEFAIDVKRKKFHAVAVHRPDGSEGSTLKLRGKLTDKGRRATGTIRVFGSPPLESGNTGVNCHTGKRPWSAERD
jgi:hypothetical protein